MNKETTINASEKRFWSKVYRSSVADACWPWTSSTNDEGYGTYWSGGKAVKAHRHCYAAQIGPIPKGMKVCHSCDNPPCCNPAHFFLGTDADNAKDKAEKKRCNPCRGDSNGMRTKPDSVLRGKRNPGAKLNEEQVIQIRALAGKSVNRAEIGSMFGVTKYNVTAIVQRKTWRHVA